MYRSTDVLTHRLITGPVLIAILLLLLWWDETIGQVSLGMDSVILPTGIVITGLCVLVSALAARECVAILKQRSINVSLPILTAACWAVLLVAWGAQSNHSYDLVALLLVLGATWFISLAWAVRQCTVDGATSAATATVAIAIYLGGMLSFLLILRDSVSAWWIAALVLIVKAGDIGAYFTGLSIGKQKLISWLSPGKTVEGMIGGLACSAAAAWVALALLGSPTPAPMGMGWALLMGMLLGAAGQCGDLTMSLLKRDAGLKDSSNLLPGMGGIMDVLDSLLLAAPIAYLLMI